MSMLDAVYMDAKEEKRIVAIKPKLPFRPIFQVATTKEGSGAMLLNEPPENTPKARACFWWRWGRVELGLKRGLTLLISLLPNRHVRRLSPVGTAIA